jgi:hypothetical protein
LRRNAGCEQGGLLHRGVYFKQQVNITTALCVANP